MPAGVGDPHAGIIQAQQLANLLGQTDLPHEPARCRNRGRAGARRQAQLATPARSHHADPDCHIDQPPHPPATDEVIGDNQQPDRPGEASARP
jgi:hypothetical protein